MSGFVLKRRKDREGSELVAPHDRQRTIIPLVNEPWSHMQNTTLNPFLLHYLCFLHWVSLLRPPFVPSQTKFKIKAVTKISHLVWLGEFEL